MTPKGQAVERSAIVLDEENCRAIGRPILRIIVIPLDMRTSSAFVPITRLCKAPDVSANTSSRPSGDQTGSLSAPNVSLSGTPVATSSSHSPAFAPVRSRAARLSSGDNLTVPYSPGSPIVPSTFPCRSYPVGWTSTRWASAYARTPFCETENNPNVDAAGKLLPP